MNPIEDLIRPLTSDEVLERFLQILEDAKVPARSWRKAGALRTILRVASIVYSDFTVLMAAAIRGGFLDLAEGNWLTALAKYVYGVERKPATFATGKVRFKNTGGGSFAPGDYPAGSVRVYSSETKKAYLNAEPLSLGAFETKLVGIIAVEQGADSAAAPETIDSLETQLLGVEVINPDAAIGSDEENDEDLRQACRNKLASISGLRPRGVYEWAVRQARRPDGSPTNINRVVPSEASSTSEVTVYLASPSGAPLTVDLDAARDSIEAIARPAGVRVYVLPATEVAYSRSLTVWMRRTQGVDAQKIKSDVDAALREEIRKYKIGGYKKPPSNQGKLYSDFITGTAKSVHASIFDVDLNDASDLNLATGEVVTLAVTTDVRIV